MATLLEIDQQLDRGTALLRLTGEIDLASSPVLLAAVREQLSDPAVTGILIDLADVRFLDSSGVGALLQCRNRAGDVDKEMHVRGARGLVRDVLNITGVSVFLGVAPTT